MGRLAIGCVGSATYSVLPALSRRLTKELPGVDFSFRGEMLAPDQVEALRTGAIDVALAGAAAVLREAAAWIDAHPRADAQRVAARARLAVEHAATRVLDHAGRALGAGPLCRDARFARAMADLPVFLRQSHAERDLASLGTGLLPEEESPWKL